MRSLRIGIDSYCLHPLRLSPLEVLEWAADHGADGVQFTELHLPHDRSPDAALLSDLAGLAQDRRLYLEWGGGQHIPYDTTTWKPRDIAPVNRVTVEQAAAVGTTVVRSCSGGLMRWHDSAPPTEVLLRDMAAALKPQQSMLADHGVTLAIETHFEFTTFELLRLFEMCDAQPGGPLGICLDTMNLLTMLEDPIAGTKRILPWVVSTHAKDGALLLVDEGLVSFPTALGAGLIDWHAVLRELSALDHNIAISIEDHGGSFTIPVFDPVFLSRFPDLTAKELASLLHLTREAQRRLDRGDLTMTDRAHWPDICEERTALGITNLKQKVADFRTGDQADA